MWLRLRRWLVFMVMLLLAACGTAPISSGSYTVKRGDTLYSIATRHGVSVTELIKLNNIDSDHLIYPGQVLRLSRAAARPGSQDRASQPTSVTANESATRELAARIRWSWPASSGSYTATTRPNGGVGLLINGVRGQDIKSAAAGRVVYTGSGLLGYGQLIIIKHDDACLSAYGHLDTLLVHESESVLAGQKIAAMGNGPTGSPLLYFEIRVNGQPIAPLPLLQGQK